MYSAMYSEDSSALRGAEAREHLLPLTALSRGAEARIAAVEAEGELRMRLTELGYLPGEKVKKVLMSPLGDPCAYLVRGTVTALRGGDAERIFISGEAEKWA